MSKLNKEAAKAAIRAFREHPGQMGCRVVDCPHAADGGSEWCLKHLTPRSRLNGVRVTITAHRLVKSAVPGLRFSGVQETDVIVVKSTAKAGKILELARKEKGLRVASIEIRPEIECFDIADTRFRKLR